MKERRYRWKRCDCSKTLKKFLSSVVNEVFIQSEKKVGPRACTYNVAAAAAAVAFTKWNSNQFWRAALSCNQFGSDLLSVHCGVWFIASDTAKPIGLIWENKVPTTLRIVALLSRNAFMMSVLSVVCKNNQIAWLVEVLACRYVATRIVPR